MGAKRFRKRPVEVEAFFVTRTQLEACAAWCDGLIEVSFEDDPCIIVRTREGDMRARLGDYVIRGVKGEFYPCKPDIFRTTYEMVM